MQQEEDKKIRDKIQAKFEAFRSYVLIIWTLTNGAYISILTSIEDVDSVYLNIVFIAMLVLSAFRFIGSTLYLITNALDSCRKVPVPRYPSPYYSEA
jgi:hypothetical protein